MKAFKSMFMDESIKMSSAANVYFEWIFTRMKFHFMKTENEKQRHDEIFLLGQSYDGAQTDAFPRKRIKRENHNFFFVSAQCTLIIFKSMLNLKN